MMTGRKEDTTPQGRIARVLAERCRIAGGARAGFSLRRTALEALAGGGRVKEEISAGVEELVRAGYLQSNASGTRLYLTEAGVTWLSGPDPAAVATPQP